MRLDDGLVKFCLQLRANGRSPLTIAQYRRHIELLIRWCGASYVVEAITPEDLALFLVLPESRARADGQAKKPASMNALRAALKVFFGFLFHAGYLAHDPSRLIAKARCTPAPPRALSDDERERLLEALRDGS